MKIKFKEPYADWNTEAGYKSGHTYDFIDTKKANYFIDYGLAIAVEDLQEPEVKTAKKGKKNELDPINAK